MYMKYVLFSDTGFRKTRQLCWAGLRRFGTRSARGGGLYLSTRDHGSVGYRVPKVWAT